MQKINLGDQSIGTARAGRFLFMGLAVSWLYFDVVRRLVRDWYIDENYSHGFLVPLIAGYAWHKGSWKGRTARKFNAMLDKAAAQPAKELAGSRR